jgi:hypothetical protein
MIGWVWEAWVTFRLAGPEGQHSWDLDEDVAAQFSHDLMAIDDDLSQAGRGLDWRRHSREDQLGHESGSAGDPAPSRRLSRSATAFSRTRSAQRPDPQVDGDLCSRAAECALTCRDPQCTTGGVTAAGRNRPSLGQNWSGVSSLR